MDKKEKVVLLISCPDRKGIIAKVANFIYSHGGNIEHSDEHTDFETNTFFMRIVWSLHRFKIKPQQIPHKFAPLAKEFSLKWRLHFFPSRPQVAIFVSRQLHCLYDLLLRYEEGQFHCNISLVISNHKDAEKIVKSFGIKFFYFPLGKRNVQDVEKEELALLEEHNIEIVVLARYMRILSSNFIKHFPQRIINIHHSFLPAFAGARPYRQAYLRGVKLIGATSHYVTAEVDSGPIIEQDTVRVSHRDSLADFVRKGKDLEKIVLSRALLWHLERKILVYRNKTVIFD